MFPNQSRERKLNCFAIEGRTPCLYVVGWVSKLTLRASSVLQILQISTSPVDIQSPAATVQEF